MTRMKLTGALLSSIVLTAAVATPAFAALGGDSATVQADVARMKGVLRITSSAGVTVHEITTSYGTVVREYLTPGDKVFAVSWHGPVNRSEEHTSELQSLTNLVCRLLLEKKKKKKQTQYN